MMALDSLGVLDTYSGVFDIAKYRKNESRYKAEQIRKYGTDGFARDNVDFAREQGLKMPNKLAVKTKYLCKSSLSLPVRILRRLISKK